MKLIEIADTRKSAKEGVGSSFLLHEKKEKILYKVDSTRALNQPIPRVTKQ